MPLVSYRTQINTSFDNLWQHLLAKIENPEQFIPVVTRSEILERPGENCVIRLMYLDDGSGEQPTKEIISHDIHSKTIIFKMTDNPVWSGFVVNSVLDDNHGLELDITMHWQSKVPGHPAENAPWAEIVKDAVLQTKKLAEAT
ncbi:MAG: AtaL-like protein [Aestuariibacter sp.]